MSVYKQQVILLSIYLLYRAKLDIANIMSGFFENVQGNSIVPIPHRILATMMLLCS
jgi:hypothetical protein